MWALSIFPSQCPRFKCCQADLRHLPASSGERVCAPNGLDALSPSRAAPSKASCTSASSIVLKGHRRPALYAAATAAGCPRCSAQEGREAGLPLGRHTPRPAVLVLQSGSTGAGTQPSLGHGRGSVQTVLVRSGGPWPGTGVNKALWLLLCGGNTTLPASVVCSRRDAKASESERLR